MLIQGNTGVLNILCVPNVKNPFWVTGITRGKDWHIAKLITTSYSVTCVTCVTKLFKEMCSLPSTKLGN